MASPGGAAQRTEKKGGGLTWLLVGIVLGAVGAFFLPGLLAPYLPSALRPAETEVAGVVQSKSAETDRLLLTVGSDAGATLVTFTKDVAKFDQFIGVGDSVRLAVREYSPFIDDPEIRRVMKASDWRASPPSATAATPGSVATPGARSDTAPDTAVVPAESASAAAVGDTAAGTPGDTGAPAETVP